LETGFSDGLFAVCGFVFAQNRCHGANRVRGLRHTACLGGGNPLSAAPVPNCPWVPPWGDARGFCRLKNI